MNIYPPEPKWWEVRDDAHGTTLRFRVSDLNRAWDSTVYIEVGLKHDLDSDWNHCAQGLSYLLDRILSPMKMKAKTPQTLLEGQATAAYLLKQEIEKGLSLYQYYKVESHV